MTGRHSPDHGLPELKWPTDPNVYGIIADGADTGHVAVQLADGTIRTDRRDAPTVEPFNLDPDVLARRRTSRPTIADILRDHPDIVRRSLRMMARTWLIGDFDPRSLHRRTGRELRRYRGEHRTGAWTVAALTSACRAQQAARRADHRRALRRPFEPMVYLGEHRTPVRFYGVPGPGPDADAIRATLTIAGDDAEPEWTLVVPNGAPGPGEPPAADDADTGPLVWQPATAMLADMFEPWPSVEALCSTPA